MDQRRSLRRLIAQAASVPEESIADERLVEFKVAVSRVLTEEASAILLDPEFGRQAFEVRATGCGLLVTYESDGYENPRPHRMLELMPNSSVLRLRDMGADGIKILLSYTPHEDKDANDRKCAMVERIGHECDALHMPFFLEPVGYDPSGLDVRSLAYAKLKPEVVIQTMEEFSRDRYRVDILKVEFPIDAGYLGEAYSKTEALEIFRRADATARCPYIYLSAGVASSQFTESLQLAAEAGARFSGVLCGRANWQEGVPTFANQGLHAFEEWLQTKGLANVQAVNECLQSATPCHGWFPEEAARN